MNKVTKKYCSIFADNANNKIIKKYNPNFIITPALINQSIKKWHIHYDKNIKKKLGKRKIYMTNEKFWSILDEYEEMDANGETYIPERYTKDVAKEIIENDKTFFEAEHDAYLMWKGYVPELAKKMIIDYYKGINIKKK